MGAHPGSLGERNARNAPCPKPAVCPAQWRTARPARSHRLRSARNATRRPGGVGLSCWAIACGGGPPPKARKSCTGCACASGCGTTHGTVARVCCNRQATGATPTVRKERFSSERGRTPEHPHARACCWYVLPGGWKFHPRACMEGKHVAAAKGARGARVGGGVTVVSLVPRCSTRDSCPRRPSCRNHAPSSAARLSARVSSSRQPRPTPSPQRPASPRYLATRRA